MPRKITQKNHTSHLECLVYIKIERKLESHKSIFKSCKHIFCLELDQCCGCILEKIYLLLGKTYLNTYFMC